MLPASVTLAPVTLAMVSVLGVSLLPFAAFTWAIKGHFRCPKGIPRGMKRITALSLGAFLWFCWRLFSGPPAATWPFATLLFALSLAIFGWAVRVTRRSPPTVAFSDDQPSFLLREGPYRYVRHPFYLAYLTFWIGTAAATTGGAGWLAPLVMLIVYRVAAGFEEEKFAHSALAGAYAAYRAKVGMFLPRPSTLLAD